MFEPTKEAVSAYFADIIRLIASKLRFDGAEWQSPPELLDELHMRHPQVHQALKDFHRVYEKWAEACRQGRHTDPDYPSLAHDRDQSRAALVRAVGAVT